MICEVMLKILKPPVTYGVHKTDVNCSTPQLALACGKQPGVRFNKCFKMLYSVSFYRRLEYKILIEKPNHRLSVIIGGTYD